MKWIAALTFALAAFLYGITSAASSSDTLSGCVRDDGVAVVTKLNERGRTVGTINGVPFDQPATYSPNRGEFTFTVQLPEAVPARAVWDQGRAFVDLPMCSPTPTTTEPNTSTTETTTWQPTPTTTPSTTSSSTPPTTPTTVVASTSTPTTAPSSSTSEAPTTTAPSDLSSTTITSSSSIPSTTGPTLVTGPPGDIPGVTPEGELPRTGATINTLTAIGIALIVVGGSILLIQRGTT